MLRCVSSHAPSRAAFCAVALGAALSLAAGMASAQEPATEAQDAAALDADAFRRHFPYAEPSAAIRLGVRLARMDLERGQVQAELHGGASHRTPSQALPPGLEE